MSLWCKEVEQGEENCRHYVSLQKEASATGTLQAPHFAVVNAEVGELQVLLFDGDLPVSAFQVVSFRQYLTGFSMLTTPLEKFSQNCSKSVNHVQVNLVVGLLKWSYHLSYVFCCAEPRGTFVTPRSLWEPEQLGQPPNEA